MENLTKLKNTRSLSDLATVLGYEPKALAFILYKIPDNNKYTSFNIPKKTGGEREIKAPTPKLKVLQKRLAQLLYQCSEEILPQDERLGNKSHFSRRRERHAVSHGFKKGLSITSNAEIHVNKRYVLNIDLENFFPSINFGRVRGYFIKNKYFQLDPNIATILAQIACHNNELPQGSPCSPIISNLVTRILDSRLVKLAQANKCIFSRYADDLTFSTNQQKFPIELAYLENLNWVVGSKLTSTINQSGFNIKTVKTRMQFKQSRQMVTGLVVNRTVNVRSDYYRYARSMCNDLFRKGTYFSPDQSGKYFSSTSHLEGILNHIYHIKNYRNKFAQEGYRKTRHDGYRSPKHEHELSKYPPLNRCNQYTDKSHRVAIDGIKNLYSKFIFFKYFYFLGKPLIFCEGPTDNIYLGCAIKQLATSYPNLVGISDNKQKTLKVNFFNRTETNSEMLKLAEGSSGMKFIALGYERLMKRYVCSGKLHPVIMILDNDKGGNDALLPFKLVKKVNENTFHISENLYAIQIPKQAGNDTEIEDYFESSVLSTEINGKKFNRNNTGHNTQQFYGKSIFAKAIVQKNQSSINFNNFRTILDLVEIVIDDYKNVVSQATPTTQFHP